MRDEAKALETKLYEQQHNYDVADKVNLPPFHPSIAETHSINGHGFGPPRDSP